jgi:hypothetical protein
MLFRFLKRTMTPVLLGLAAILIAAEELLWQLAKIYAILGKLPVFRTIEVWIQRLPPYGALAILGLPAVALAPVKLLAFYWLASGHAILGGSTIITAKIAGTAFVARLYQLTRPALLQLGWFSWSEFQVLRLRAAAYALWANSAIGRLVIQQMRALREWLKLWRQRRKTWIARRWQAVRMLLRRRLA